ncbi:MAG: phosphoribosyl-ATP diphosphatase [Sulfolobales archaeon]
MARVSVFCMDILKELYEVIIDRINKRPPESYTSYIVSKGSAYVARKFGEESLEVMIASLSESRERITYEVADLLYHLLVLLAVNGITLDEVYEELRRRRK